MKIESTDITTWPTSMIIWWVVGSACIGFILCSLPLFAYQSAQNTNRPKVEQTSNGTLIIPADETATPVHIWAIHNKDNEPQPNLEITGYTCTSGIPTTTCVYSVTK